METQILYALISVLLISLASLVGVFALSVKQDVLRRITFLLVSLATGALLGASFIHLLPEAYASIPDPVSASLFVLAGFLLFFVLEKFLHWRHSHTVENATDGDEVCLESHEKTRIKPVGFLVLISDGLHNFLDGIIIGASYLISIEVGIAATIAVLLHELPQEIGDFGLLLHAGFSRGKALFVNFLSALTALFGVVLVLIVGEAHELIVPAITALAAGSFLYIAGSDLVPELHKVTLPRRSFQQFTAMILGLLVMFGLLAFDTHGHGAPDSDHAESEHAHIEDTHGHE